MNNSIKNWKPGSWINFKAKQQPSYPDKERLDEALLRLSRLPPLVSSWEIESLKSHLSIAQKGEAFILQGGDCAETFSECNSENIVQKLKILLQMSLVLSSGLKKPVIRIGRLAGQYAKPRSSDEETIDGVSLPSYRGDLINRIGFTKQDRVPDPELLIKAYNTSAMTLNFVRSLIDGGFADLHHPENWDLSLFNKSPMAKQYQNLVDSVSNSMNFFESITGNALSTQRADIYTSHEGLHLPYEQAQTRFLEHRNSWYNLTTHFPWIGMRTADLDGAHVEYYRGISNPMGIKIGTGCSDDHLISLVEKLNPANEMGRMVLITRFGASEIDDHLPRVIKAMEKIKANILWICDPMHGNTESTKEGYKTRRFDNVVSEIKSAFSIHKKLGSYLGGVHLELTGENVTECIGGASGLTELDLSKAYKTQVDPRLNYEQAMEVAILIADHIKKN
ncbi:MAG: 3-deoxy-7-phosphoheptulonate synthase class II [Gammaproteobacteria bacterium TMED78]|nr:MAG: 3-deoxy-7-phosphoheptulonate synthase class II [Gammaproteobacteria bacterium TMED78]|tara:strand:+ start:71075 stop:72421 length:1347 start_codon:yes stop_codon:yes gene_type:complete